MSIPKCTELGLKKELSYFQFSELKNSYVCNQPQSICYCFPKDIFSIFRFFFIFSFVYNVKDLVSLSSFRFSSGEKINTSSYPSLLKRADITSVRKKDSKSAKNNYRPISILSNISKLYGRIMPKQMS